MCDNKKYIFLTLESKETEFLFSGFDYMTDGQIIAINRGKFNNRITRRIIKKYTQENMLGVLAKALTKRVVQSQIVDKIIDVFDKQCVFIVYARVYESLGRFLVDELKRIFRDAICCVYFADLQKRFAINLESYKRDFDYLFCFDKKQSEQYNLHYLMEPFTYKPLDESKITPIYDITYVGRVKNDMNRFNGIIRTFEECRKVGLSCDFHIVDVPKKLQKYANEIEYNKFMRFEDIVNHVIQSHAVLEILQTDEYSPTTRYTEACLYGRNLITNCEGIKDGFYRSDSNIFVLDESTSIDASWVREKHGVDKDEYIRMFSIKSFVDSIEGVISETRSESC